MGEITRRLESNGFHEEENNYIAPTEDNPAVRAMIGIDASTRSSSKVVVINEEIIIAWRQEICPQVVGIGKLIVDHHIPAKKAMEFSYLLCDLLSISRDFIYQGNKYNMQEEAEHWIARL